MPTKRKEGMRVEKMLASTWRAKSSWNHSGYRRYLYHQGNEQTTGGTVEAAAKPWLIPAGK